MRYFLKAAVFFIFLFCCPQVKAIELEEITLKVPAKYRNNEFRQRKTLKVYPGIRVSVFAAGLEGPRFMAFGPSGVLYVALPSKGQIVALPDADRDGVADGEAVFAEGLHMPHSLAFTSSGFIVAETDGLVLLEDSNKDLRADRQKLLSEDIPPGGHWTRSVVAGPDNYLYVSVGSSCNACVETDRRRAAILRFKKEGGEAEVFATGLRNSVGLAFHPDTGDLWAVDNGTDWLGDDLPPEELNRIEQGKDYGWPFCYGDKKADPNIGSIERCRKTQGALAMYQAHSAPLGIAFGSGLRFPEEMQNWLFIAFHGSWNRSKPTGYKLIAQPFESDGPAGKPVDIISGWLEKGEVWGRPAGVIAGKDGALYISDDKAGAIYRITYME